MAKQSSARREARKQGSSGLAASEALFQASLPARGWIASLRSQ
jgi:hypothetical protein